MIGYVCLPRVSDDDPADRLLRNVAHKLRADGIALAGAVQSGARDRAGKMRLELLGGGGTSEGGPGAGEEWTISHEAKVAAHMCRLDSGALELAVVRIAAALPGAQLVILNKFGKREAAGRGMRTLIADAVERDLPVLISVSPEVLDAFHEFSGGMAEMLDADAGEVEAWCRAAVAAVAA